MTLTFTHKLRLAATPPAVMFGSWVFIVHTPHAVAAAGKPNEWTSLLIALAMCGSSLIAMSCVNRMKSKSIV
ncbi:MAG: hypothetical protein ABJC26_09885 [Gemmatimonadaceae bacterium]